MEWTKADGATHPTMEDCAAAPAVLELRGPQPELPDERARVERLLLSHPWKAATSKAYAKLPHEYSLRRLWPHDEEFAWWVEYIRRVGYQERFIGRVGRRSCKSQRTGLTLIALAGVSRTRRDGPPFTLAASAT